MSFFSRFRTQVVERAARIRSGFFGREIEDAPVTRGETLRAIIEARMAESMQAAKRQAVAQGATDSECDTSIAPAYRFGGAFLPDALLGFFLNTGFIGAQVCGILSQHWLIRKACFMPARDATRKGYEIVTEDGQDLDPATMQKIRNADKRMRVAGNLREFVGMGRVFGVRVAFFDVDSTDPNYYEYPFNPDGVRPGSYRGIVQVDPYWVSPILDRVASADPASRHFYEPTFWQINNKRYHRSHCIIYRNGELPDVLKPQYQYGGVPVPQLILERVYNAERTANEAPQLAMTKRTTVMGVDAAKALANETEFKANLAVWTNYRDNYGVKVVDKDEETIEQFDTSLADLDAVIMTSYQLVAAAANVPATKLLGTSPKGFNASGEYEEANYHEELESIQADDLTPLLERHYELLSRSLDLGLSLSINWHPLDSMTAEQQATVNKLKAETGAALIASGAIDSTDERNRIRIDKKSDYVGLDPAPVYEPEPDPLTVAQPGPVMDGLDDVRLVTNQKQVDDEIVGLKLAARDFAVQVSPVFASESGQRYRIVIDGHHSLAAAKLAGVEPELIEGDYVGSDYGVVGKA